MILIYLLNKCFLWFY